MTVVRRAGLVLVMMVVALLGVRHSVRRATPIVGGRWRELSGPDMR